MYKSINLDAVVEHLKNIVDSSRCAVCDRTDGKRMRYTCGHTSCEDCVILAADCSVCLTPPQNGLTEPVTDGPFTQRAADAVNLLNVFQNEFHIDVYKRLRISEQLKVEKELFPECIQAPVKYFNKRKSFKNTVFNKENSLSQLPGEEVSLIGDLKMENSRKDVEIWLSKHVRKPFKELNSNSNTLRKNTQIIKKQQNASINENTPLKQSNRKRSYLKPALVSVKNQFYKTEISTPAKKTKLDDKVSSINEIFMESDTSKYLITGTYVNNENDESGIVIDDEAVVVIDDSQSVKIDKDMEACLAILEAERNKQYKSTSFKTSINDTLLKNKQIEVNKITKVPFYLKGCLSNDYINCTDAAASENITETNETNKNDINTIEETNKDVSITVENKNFIAIIKIQQIDQSTNKPNGMQSVHVQTVTPEVDSIQSDIEIEDTPNQDLFQENRIFVNDKGMSLQSLNKTGHVVIEESDSDDDFEPSVSLEVTAEIHRSCEDIDYGILADVDDIEEHSKRARRGPRGVTPTSSNSSEKENYNPNRMKKAYPSKKKPMKK